jgi:hypothetical protein
VERRCRSRHKTKTKFQEWKRISTVDEERETGPERVRETRFKICDNANNTCCNNALKKRLSPHWLDSTVDVSWLDESEDAGLGFVPKEEVEDEEEEEEEEGGGAFHWTTHVCFNPDAVPDLVTIFVGWEEQDEDEEQVQAAADWDLCSCSSTSVFTSFKNFNSVSKIFEFFRNSLWVIPCVGGERFTSVTIESVEGNS